MSGDEQKCEGLLADALAATASQRRRISEVRARQHVGAAGWAQTSTLEAIIRAGREGWAATDALRQVMKLTSERLDLMPLGGSEEERSGHRQALRDVVENGELQLATATALDDLICAALDEVSCMPADDLNVHRLRRIHDRLQEQVAALRTIVEIAHAQASSVEQLAELSRLSAEYRRRVEDIAQFSARQEAQALAQAGEKLVQRIGELDEAAPEQLDALTQIGEAVGEYIQETGAAQAEQAEALEKLASGLQERAEALRRG
ncbi:hypothetical protein SAMN04488058_104185 [Deinococcus reticulitermitis]|uniref:Uncharacterized protein n=1 Tax=Deinococcus reticulitermitis TaxID=856736 RepID=A0A1H6WHW6_9DEIO|nr:hypothetical protein SAMN04488058_104185 [Deinococcus reticulitermitis]